MNNSIQIKHRHTGAVLFECESGLTMRETLEKATEAKAYLRDADLRGADLYGANLRDANLYGADLRDANLYGANLRDAKLRDADLRDANLYGADLRGADLYGADLYGADLRDANLRDANLYRADLRGADLRGADLGGKKLVSNRAFITIGPIGSRSDYLMAFLTDAGVMVRAGCFFDTRAKFELQLASTHGDNEHAQEYRAALVLIDKHAELWTRKAEKEADHD